MQKLTIYLVILLLTFSHLPELIAQNNDQLWEPMSTLNLQSRQSESKRTLPKRFKAFQLTDFSELSAQMSIAPLRFSDDSNSDQTVIQLPMPNGQLEAFRIYESPILTGKTADLYPDIKTYTAAGIDDLNAIAKIDISPQGFHGMVLSAGKSPVFIEPFIVSENSYYSYYKKDATPSDESFYCGVSEANLPDTPDQMASSRSGDCQFREYRLALACTGEYAQFHDDGNDGNGDIIADVVAAMATSMNRVNGVFETDAGITMVLVPNNVDLIFTDAGSDPYSNGNGGAMLGQNQTTCDDVIGSANYDIGHVFSTGGGGVAYLRSPCGGNKAGGVTGQGSPVGDQFDIDYVAHEMGHQYGGNHTQNNNCQRSSASYEPGSASTIMGYAGICSPNVQNNSDAYFHARSVEEMGNFVTGNGNSCATIINTTNNAPTADAGANYTIPVSTPFVLTGIASDSDDDPITYCWEQWDNEVATMPPASTSTSGPAFRSFDPTPDPKRYFPRLSVLAGPGTDIWEVLPSVSRDMDFRLIVRDNNNAYGCTEEDNMTVSTNASAGPFLITYPNVGEEWIVGDTKTITWDVANTDASPINCANVDILYSTDGGVSFSNTLASDVANNGSYDAIVPNISSSQVRFMVICADNIFFAVTNVDINIGTEVICLEYNSTDVPVVIPSSGSPTVTSNLSIPLGEDVTDINVLNLEGTHTYLSDLTFSLISPAGTTVTLVSGQCGNDDDFDINFDNEGGALVCPYNDDQTTAPVGALSDFNSTSPAGDWILEIADGANADGGSLDSWTLQICYEEAGPLPVELINFEAKASKNSIQLEWNTASEVDNSGFEIQRSTIANRSFEKIGWVDGLGNAESGHYTFDDLTAIAGTDYYYRLKQIDFSTKYSFSPIRTARIKGADYLSLELAPNPVSDQLNLSLTAKGSFDGEAQVVNAVGKIVEHFSFDGKDIYQKSLELSHIPSGIYFLKIVDENGIILVERFLKN